jgi:glycosyltransferase involved in cell wall biosynthesis
MHYVSETLNSAMNQVLGNDPYPNLEIIVINDASTDGSWAVVEEYMKRDSRIKGINLTENVGLPAARNIAIAASTGDLILPLDADDKIDSRYLEKTVPKMTDGVGIVTTYMEISDTGQNSQDTQAQAIQFSIQPRNRF